MPHRSLPGERRGAEGRAAAFIDFDFATPADPLFDIAVAARHWIPLRDPADITDARTGTDLVERFGRFSDVHHLRPAQRDRVVQLLLDFLDDSLRSIRAKAASGHPGYAQLWAEGYESMNRRSRSWLLNRRTELRTAGGGS